MWRKWRRRILVVLLALLFICALFYMLFEARPQVPVVVPFGEYVYVVPEGSWHIFGPLSGSYIKITANTSVDVMVGAASAVFVARDFPNGSVTWDTKLGTISLVRDGDYYAVVLNDVCFAGLRTSYVDWSLVVPVAVGMGSADFYKELCKKAAQHPVLWRGDIRVDYILFRSITRDELTETMFFGLHGGGSARGVPEKPARTEFVRYYYQYTQSVELDFKAYEKRVNVNGTTYVIYMRPAVWIAVRPFSDAVVSIKVSDFRSSGG